MALYSRFTFFYFYFYFCALICVAMKISPFEEAVSAAISYVETTLLFEKYAQRIMVDDRVIEGVAPLHVLRECSV